MRLLWAAALFCCGLNIGFASALLLGFAGYCFGYMMES